MKVVVIGSGLLGVSTAYFLKCRGFDVTVIDREQGPGFGASFANGSLLTPSMAEPWNSPGVWRVLLSSLGRSDSAMQVRLRAMPAMASWAVKFLWNSKRTAFERNTLTNLRLSIYSLQTMKSLRQLLQLEYDYAGRGTLRVFRSKAALDRASASAEQRISHGLSFRRLSPSESIELEPALEPIADQLVGAIYYGNDETGDAHRFCATLAEHSRRQGVRFRFRTEVLGLEVRAGRVKSVITQLGPLFADQYIVAAGSYTGPFLRSAGLRLPIQPVKGYSVTFPEYRDPTPLLTPVVDDDLHAAVVPLGQGLRIAGTAEFAGYDRELKRDRIHNLFALARAVLPQWNFDPQAARPWCGLRPVSPDGVPIIGATPLSNLWLNTGHGHLGWTMAAGSGRLLAALISNEPTEIDPTLFALARFGSSRRSAPEVNTISGGRSLAPRQPA